MTYIEKKIKGISWNKYHRVHYWIYSKLGKATYCSENKDHTAKRFEWANISGEYLMDIKDWKQLCPSCHRKFDYTDEQKAKTSKICLKNNYAKKCPIKQLTLDGKTIMVFTTIKEASIKLNIIRTAITNCLNGDTKTSGGYLWQHI